MVYGVDPNVDLRNDPSSCSYFHVGHCLQDSQALVAGEGELEFLLAFDIDILKSVLEV